MIKFRNGFIYKDGRYYTSMTVDNDKVLSVSDDEMCITEEVVDLKGKYVYPGFHDSHMHLENFGKTLSDVVLNNCNSIMDMIKVAIDFIDKNPTDVLFGRGWNQDYFSEHRMPSKYDLDQISKDIPIVFVRTCGHILVCNSKAVEKVNVNFEIDGGEYNNETGIFCETACDYVIRLLSPKRTVAKEKEYILRALKEANKYGITSLGTNDIYDYKKEAVSKAYYELERENKLTAFIYHQIGSTIKDYNELKDLYNGLKYNICDAIKIFMDGSLGAKTAWLNNNYLGENHNGVCAINLKELEELIVEASKLGIRIVGHAIGDQAIDVLANLYSKADNKNRNRNSIIHVQITDKDILKRIAENNILAYTQPIFIDYDMHIVRQRVGNLADTSYAFKTLKDMGVHESFGTDCPVESLNPFNNIYCAVTRCDLKENGPYLLKEQFSIKEAFDAYTIEGAYAVNSERKIGRLDNGYYANFFMLDRDLFSVEPKELKSLKPLCTYVCGKKVS